MLRSAIRLVGTDLLLRLVAAMLAVAAAVCAVLSVAALADGHLPRPATLRDAALPLAAFLGGAWTLAAWRAEGADVALANTGLSPSLAVAGVALAASMVLAAGTAAPATAPPAWALALRPGTLVVHAPTGAHRYTWDAVGARREGDGARFESLPAPTVTRRRAAPRDATLALVATRCALLLLVLGWLGRRLAPPGLALTFGASGGAFALAHLAGLWFG